MLEPIEFKDFYLASNADVEIRDGLPAKFALVSKPSSFAHLSSALSSFAALSSIQKGSVIAVISSPRLVGHRQRTSKRGLL